MAVIKSTSITTLHTNASALQWLGMKQGDVGAAVVGAQYSSKTVHIHGDFGTGAAVTVRGSNMEAPDVSNPEHWFPLTDDLSNQITKTARGGCNISESPLWISPACGAETDGSAAINVSLCGRN